MNQARIEHLKEKIAQGYPLTEPQMKRLTEALYDDLVGFQGIIEEVEMLAWRNNV